MRNFYIVNRRASEPNTPRSGVNGVNGTNGIVDANRLQRRERLRYRDMIWAFHSESQDLLLSASIAACGGKMCWPDARALGVFTWMRSTEALVRHIAVDTLRVKTHVCVIASEIAHGSRGTQRIHGGGQPRPDRMQPILLRAGEGEACARTVETSGMAQGAAAHAKVSQQ